MHVIWIFIIISALDIFLQQPLLYELSIIDPKILKDRDRSDYIHNNIAL